MSHDPTELVDDAGASIEGATVSVFDEAGDPIADASVSDVSPNEKVGAESSDCSPFDDVHYCGEEVAGELEIYAEGFEPQNAVVTTEPCCEGAFEVGL